MDKIKNIFGKLKPILIILHGSQSQKKKDLHLSDFDLIIVSNIFENIIFFDRIKMIETILTQSNIGFKIDAIGLTEKEFQKDMKKESKLLNSLRKGFKVLLGDFQIED